MTIQANKKIVDAFLAEFDRRNIPGLLGMMTDDATWWVNGTPELFDGARTRSKAEIAEVWQGLFDRLEGGLTMNVVSIIGEGDSVAAEVACRAITTTGRAYENDYYMVFVLRDRRIAAVREYTDLLHAAETFA
jgi:ketosteroid isomerase-like protein